MATINLPEGRALMPAIFAAAIAIGVAAFPSAAGGPLSDPMSFLVWWDCRNHHRPPICDRRLRLRGSRRRARRCGRHLHRAAGGDDDCGRIRSVSATAGDHGRLADIGSATPSTIDSSWASVPVPRPPFHSSRPTPTHRQSSRRRRPPIAGRSSQATTSGRSRRPSSPNAAGRKPEARLPPTGARCSRRMQTISLIRI